MNDHYGTDWTTVALIVVGLLANFVIFIIIFVTQYKKVGPNRILVVSGLKRRIWDKAGGSREVGFRIVKGGGTFVWPFIEKAEVLSLETIPAQLSILGLEASCHFRIKGDDVSIYAAAERFLSKTTQEISALALEIVERQARKALNEGKRDYSFIEKQIIEEANRDLAPLGLEMPSFTVRDIRNGAFKG